MKRLRVVSSMGIALLPAMLLWLPAVAWAQSVTTGSLAGSVTDESGGVLPGVTVEAVHEPTGTRYAATTEAEGRFAIFGVRVGGPYSIVARLSGFQDEKRSNLSVSLGENRTVDFTLKVAALTETVEVSAEVASIINPTSTGPADNVSQETLENLPTLGRGLEDFARLSPYFDAKGSGDGTDRTVIAVAGRNNRYNNIQIDGAVNNDLFAISDSSAPGNLSGGQPISLDAIQELQLLVSPYDVRQGGFTGGGINAVTRSGANSFQGTAYYFLRNDSFTGDGPDERPIAPFDDKQFGASLGGPIVKDTAFFFANVDFGRRETPVGFSADGGSGQPWGHEAEVQRFVSILGSRYNYDPGGLEEFIRATDSDKVFTRLDFNLSPKHRLTVRHNYIKGVTDVGFPSSRTYYFPDNFYQPHENINSSVAQLNSTFGSAVNELRLTYQRLRTVSDGPTRFPQVIVDLADGSQVRAGRENFRAANELDQDIFELTNDLTFIRGDHHLTVGTHNEFFEFRNYFIRDNMGNYRFSSLDNLEAGFAQQYDHSFSATSDPFQAARFKVNQLGFYAGDVWRMRPHFTLTGGVRVDVPSFPDEPTANPASVANFGFATDVAPSPLLWSPRAGFNWDLRGDATQQLRGGLGLFSGRTPYVWLSNQYGNTGIEFSRIGASFNTANLIPFVPDPDNQPRVVVGAASGTFRNEIDVVDPDYEFPQVLRTNLAYDRKLGVWGLIGTAEFFYSRSLKDIDYQNLNLRPGGQTRQDGRPIFTRVNTQFSDVILLTNTSKGSQWTALLRLERPFSEGLYLSASYLYGRSKSVNDGGSSQAASNWGNVYVPGDPNHAPLSRSNFDPGHRINLAVSYDFKIGAVNTTASIFYNGQSGRPYTFIFNGDANGDGRTTNDLLYVPSGPDDVILRNGTWDQLNAFIEGDAALRDHRGQIVSRNAGRAPWSDGVDLRLAARIPTAKSVRFEVTADVLNVLNLLNSDWGVVDLATFNDLNPIRFAVDAPTGKYVYDLVTINSSTFRKFDRDDLRSRWQAQLGLRVRF
jgi:hypothetical protein